MVSFPSNEEEGDLGSRLIPMKSSSICSTVFKSKGNSSFCSPAFLQGQGLPESDGVVYGIEEEGEIWKEGEIYLVNKRHIIFVEEK